MLEMQKTIAKETQIEGVGLHTGNTSKLTFKPADVNSGIKFIRTDLKDRPEMTAKYSQVMGTPVRGTSIGKEASPVHTIEHIMATCHGLGIDNLVIEITNNEPPILDGSAKIFAELLMSAGIVEQDAPRQYYILKEPVIYESGKTRISAVPADELKIDCTVAYEHPFLKEQKMSFVLSPDAFLKELSPARTFCFDYEIEALKNKGLAKGGDFANAIVVGIQGIRNPDQHLRFPDEFVRHKTLDLIGDLYLLQKPLKAHITAVRCGHNHNINFVKQLIKSLTLVTPAKIKMEDNQMEEVRKVEGKVFDINAIRNTIPHRYPFLLVDKVIITEEMKKCTGYKCVSANENYFQGHFPGNPVMPGVLIVEAMAQTACVMLLSQPNYKGKLAYFMSIDGVKFRKLVIPGDVLELRVEALRVRERGGKVRGEAYVNNVLVTEAEFMFAIAERGEADDSSNSNS